MVDHQVVHAREQQGEVAAVEQADPLDGHVLALLEGDGLVGLGDGTLAAQAAGEGVRAVDQALAFELEVLQADAPDQGILPVAVAEILVHVPLVGLCDVIALLGRGLGRLDDGALVQAKGDVVLEADGIAAVDAGGEIDHPAALGGSGVDGGVDGGRVDMDAVADRAEITHVVHLGLQGQRSGQQEHCG